MDPAVSSDNPYSRLVALSKLGVVEDFARIRKHTVTIVGLGGIGSVAAEMLARCGIGKLIVFDYDKVELANMNRMFFLPSQVGLAKVEAALATINTINPDVTTEGHCENVCTVKGYQQLESAATLSDLVLCCVDNYTARMTINKVCLSHKIVWMESGVSESAVSGHIQTMVPGKSACFECAAPTMVVEGQPELKREGVCAASLPTTMSIIAGLLVQNALKYLLNFGQVTACLGYDALNDFFPAYPLLPNPHCNNPLCLTAQRQLAAEEVKPVNVIHKDDGHRNSLVHEQNTWGIEILPQTTEPHSEHTSNNNDKNHLSVADLMAKLKRK